MRTQVKIAVMCLLFIGKISTSSAQIDTSFWFAAPWVTPDHWWKDNVVAHISTFNFASTTVRLRQPALGTGFGYDTTITIGPNTTFNYQFWRHKLANATSLGFDSLESRPANTVQPYGLYFSSSNPITIVYDVVTRASSFLNPETYSLKAQNGLGTEFLCPFQTKWNNVTLGGDLNGDGIVTQPKQQINIVASQSNTVVWIKPRCNIVGHLAGSTYSVLLTSPGSVYTCENTVQNTTAAGNNLSGTVVVSDKPISVTVSDDSVHGVGGCYDQMGDQIVPVNIVGTDYIIIRGNLNTNEFEGGYIVATQDFTQLTMNSGAAITTTLLNKGDTYYYSTAAATQVVSYVQATKNVYCLHASGIGCELGEAILPPLSCAGSSLVAFSRNTAQNFYLNILCKNGSQGTFTLNNNTGTINAPISSTNFTVVPGTSTLSGGPYYGAHLNLVSTTTLPIGSYTIGNNTDVFALGVFDGGSTSGGLYHYMSSFLRKTIVTTATMAPVCNAPNVVVPLTGTVSGGAISGNWSTANGSGTFNPVYTSNSTTISTTYALSANDLLLDSIKFYLQSTGDCTPKIDSVVLTIHQPPIVSVGQPTTLCKNNIAPLQLTGSYTNAIGAAWTVNTGNNGGVFGPPGANTTYMPSQFDLAANSITLTLKTKIPLAGCFNDSASLVVSFIDPPTVNPGPDLTACTNTPTLAINGNVTGTGNSGVWTTTTTGLFIPGNSSPAVVYQFSASDLLQSQLIFTLTSTGNASGLCTAVSKTLAITIIPKPALIIPSDFTVCANLPVINITSTVTGAPYGVWSTLDGSGSLTQTPPSTDATYTLGPNDIINGGVTFILMSQGGPCPVDSATFHVAVLDAPVVSVNPNNSAVCKNAPINLQGLVTGYTNSGIWSSTGTGAFSPVNTALGGQYFPSGGDVSNGDVVLTLSSTNNQGCPATSKSFTATFIPSPKAAFTPDPKQCLNNGVLFTNSSLPNGTDSLSYQWTFGDSTGLSIATDPLHTYTLTGNYVITLTVSGTSAFNISCPDTTSTRIFINPTPLADFNFIDACKNLVTQFNDLSSVFGGSIVSWNWQFADQSPVATIKNPTHTYTASNSYNVLLTVTSNNHCIQSVTKLVTINPSPKAQFGLTNNPAVALEPVYFSDFSTPTATIKQWLWDFGDEGSSTEQGPSHVYQNAGNYPITLTVKDGSGCSDTVTKVINISLLPQVPTGFSPNGDGHNDLLLVRGGPFVGIVFKVYDNWGELIFETTDQKIGWDGTKNGIAQPLGSYVWTLVVNVYNNRQVKKNGDVTLIR